MSSGLSKVTPESVYKSLSRRERRRLRGIMETLLGLTSDERDKLPFEDLTDGDPHSPTLRGALQLWWDLNQDGGRMLEVLDGILDSRARLVVVASFIQGTPMDPSDAPALNAMVNEVLATAKGADPYLTVREMNISHSRILGWLLSSTRNLKGFHKLVLYAWHEEKSLPASSITVSPEFLKGSADVLRILYPCPYRFSAVDALTRFDEAAKKVRDLHEAVCESRS